jgi:hypothetical protein
MGPVAYNPEMIEKFASRLYARARGIVLVCGLVGFFLGAAAFAALAFIVPRWGLVGFVPFVFSTGIGIAYGIEKAFLLKVQAQQMLCQLAIEQNTRPIVEIVESSPSEKT